MVSVGGKMRISPRKFPVASDHVFYQCYDATSPVRRGVNALGALIGDGWYASRLCVAWPNDMP